MSKLAERLREASGEGVASGGSRLGGGSSGVVLFVDDEPHTLALVKDRLEFEGYTVHVARDAREGLEVYLAKKPGVVVADKHMPGLRGEVEWEGQHITTQGGIQLIRRLKQEADPPHLILLSGGIFPGDEGCGAAVLIDKFRRLDVLVSEVKKGFRCRESRTSV